MDNVRGEIMKIKSYAIIVAFLFLASCGGGSSGPTAPSIVVPDLASGGGTATGPATTVLNPGTFDVTVTTAIDVPIYGLQLKVTFEPSLMSTVPTVTVIPTDMFDTYEAKFENGQASSGILYILLYDTNPTVTGPGSLCVITFSNDSLVGSNQATTISFSGSIYESSVGTFSPLVIDSVDVTLG